MLGNDMTQASEGDRLRQSGQFCSAINCQSARFKLSPERKHFHSFPKDDERCKIWMNFTRRKYFDHLTLSDVYRKEEQADIAVEPACSRTGPDAPTKAELKLNLS
ncbi:uncharacterized protein LOC112561716 [Pomacea canaliculata]|uniref:uncharacterized protein LOC112561716 n=1 Tax=Pomacea canaliculata TaxID=400727 RepID=UPI000D732EA6|nr:uncharacterized protein LOC112561716 [Pomacea canaliculata]